MSSFAEMVEQLLGSLTPAERKFVELRREEQIARAKMSAAKALAAFAVSAPRDDADFDSIDSEFTLPILKKRR